MPATATEYTPDQVNIWGAAFSIGLDTKGYRLTVGANGYFGRGDALAARLDRETAVVSYAQTTSTISAVVLYIAGAVSVASKGAKQVEDKYKKRKERKKGEEDGEDENAADESSDTDADIDTDTGIGADTGTGAEPETATQTPPEESPAEPQ